MGNISKMGNTDLMDSKGYMGDQSMYSKKNYFKSETTLSFILSGYI